MPTSGMSAPHRAYWRRQITYILILLVVWAVVAFGLSIFLAEPLNAFRLGGVPMGFWMAQQGSIFAFVGLVLLYAVLMGRADRAAGLEDTDAAPPADAH